MKKTEIRLKAITHLINTHEIEDQETLVDLLKHEYDINVNQSMVSRDLRTLGVAKRSVTDKQFYEINTADVNKEILKLSIVTVEHNDTTIVIKTLPGLAAFVADYLDAQSNCGILGTIAGENVVFIAPKHTGSIKNVFLTICSLVHVKQKLKKE